MEFLHIPIDADLGFPQAFGLSVGEKTYQVSLSVTVVDEGLLATAEPLEMPQRDAYVVVTVADGERTLLRRKVAPYVEYAADELAFVFTEVVVHPRNLNGSGAFGSRITGGVARRWAS